MIKIQDESCTEIDIIPFVHVDPSPRCCGAQHRPLHDYFEMLSLGIKAIKKNFI